MNIKLILIVVLMAVLSVHASERQMINSLGISPKGQYVALEEYGYKVEKHAYYVTIKIMNLWKEEYVGSITTLEVPAERPYRLQEVRNKAKLLAQEELMKFKISG